MKNESSFWAAWLKLARVSNLPTVWTNVLAAWVLSGGWWREGVVLGLLVAGSLMYTGGMILNDAADVAFDRQHRAGRPIPSGQISARAAWSVGLVMLLGGAGLAVWCGAGLWMTLALIGAILFYDLYHKPWAGSVVVMGACRTLLYLCVASALGGQVLAQSLLLGVYIVALSLAARSRGGWWSVLLFAPLVWALVVMGTGALRHLDVFVPVWLALLVLVLYALLHLRAGKVDDGVGWLLAGIVLVDALFISSREPWLALAFVAVCPLLRLWQRWVAAT
ncbi:MAG: UbiA family prenyltransferase [Verrucomicrobiaceae bacterium]|nr:UbiA family prenyltransferase [Verrucomicrobiaceae bacterium]